MSIQTVLMNVAMACSTQNSKTLSKHAKKLVSLVQRHINITKNAIGPKSPKKVGITRLMVTFSVMIVSNYQIVI